MHFRDQLHRLGLDAQLGEIEKRDIQLLGEKLEQLFFTDEAQIHQGGPQFAPGLTLLLQRHL